VSDKYEKRERRNVVLGFLFIVMVLFFSGVVVGDGEGWASTTQVLRWFLNFWVN
jgi:hypothetical protein